MGQSHRMKERHPGCRLFHNDEGRGNMPKGLQLPKMREIRQTQILQVRFSKVG